MTLASVCKTYVDYLKRQAYIKTRFSSASSTCKAAFIYQRPWTFMEHMRAIRLVLIWNPLVFLNLRVEGQCCKWHAVTVRWCTKLMLIWCTPATVCAPVPWTFDPSHQLCAVLIPYFTRMTQDNTSSAVQWTAWPLHKMARALIINDIWPEMLFFTGVAASKYSSIWMNYCAMKF